MLEPVNRICDLSNSRVIVPEPGVPINFGRLVITPFNAQHFHGNYGVPEIGYLVEFSGKRWLFPCDTRSFKTKELPVFTNPSGMTAHCWLGKDSTLKPRIDILETFCNFFGSLNPDKIVISHLQEFGRSPKNFWSLKHFRLLKHRFKVISSKIKVVSVLMGEKFVF